jgi:peptide/nickel transport system substrate-binding protein
METLMAPAIRERRAGSALLVLVTAAMVLTGCSGSHKGSGSDAAGTSSSSAATIPSVTMGMAEKITNFDNSLPDGSFSNFAASLALEQLVVIGTDGKLHPSLAESVDHPDPTTYVYHLRHGVKFWDGNEMTATDVAFDLNYYARPDSVQNNHYLSVKSITATNPYTVTVKLKRPDASWPYTPASGQGIFEKAFFEAHKGKYGQPGVLVMATGPWKLDNLDPTSGVELSANPSWWGGRVPVKHVSVKFFSDENGEALAMRAGQVNLVPAIQDVRTFSATSGVKTKDVPACQNAYISMPVDKAPWNDVHVRRAVAYAINRTDLIKASGFPAAPSYTLIAPSELSIFGPQQQVDAALKQVPTYAHDMAKAKQELAQSSTPNGFTTALETFKYGSFINVDQVIAAELKPLGINVQIKDIGQNAWFAALEDPAKRPFTYTTSGECGLDPSYWGQILGKGNAAKGGINSANYTPPEVDKLLQDGLTTTDSNQRLSIYAQLLTKLGQDVPYITLLTQDASFASTKFTWPGYNLYWYYRPWALELKPKS